MSTGSKFRVERGVVREEGGIDKRVHVARAEFTTERMARAVFDEAATSLGDTEYLLLQEIEGVRVLSTLEDLTGKD